MLSSDLPQTPKCEQSVCQRLSGEQHVVSEAWEYVRRLKPGQSVNKRLDGDQDYPGEHRESRPSPRLVGTRSLQ